MLGSGLSGSVSTQQGFAATTGDLHSAGTSPPGIPGTVIIYVVIFIVDPTCHR
jgi:hypothetical protein